MAIRFIRPRGVRSDGAKNRVFEDGTSRLMRKLASSRLGLNRAAIPSPRQGSPTSNGATWRLPRSSSSTRQSCLKTGTISSAGAGKWCYFARTASWPWLAAGARRHGSSQANRSTSRARPFLASTLPEPSGCKAKYLLRLDGSTKRRRRSILLPGSPKRFALRGRRGWRGPHLAEFLANRAKTRKRSRASSRPWAQSRGFPRSSPRPLAPEFPLRGTGA